MLCDELNILKVSTDSIEKKFAAVETKLGIVEAAVKELSTIVKSTHPGKCV